MRKQQVCLSFLKQGKSYGLLRYHQEYEGDFEMLFRLFLWGLLGLFATAATRLGVVSPTRPTTRRRTNTGAVNAPDLSNFGHHEPIRTGLDACLSGLNTSTPGIESAQRATNVTTAPPATTPINPVIDPAPRAPTTPPMPSWFDPTSGQTLDQQFIWHVRQVMATDSGVCVQQCATLTAKLEPFMRDMLPHRPSA